MLDYHHSVHVGFDTKKFELETARYKIASAILCVPKEVPCGTSAEESKKKWGAVHYFIKMHCIILSLPRSPHWGK